MMPNFRTNAVLQTIFFVLVFWGCSESSNVRTTPSIKAITQAVQKDTILQNVLQDSADDSDIPTLQAFADKISRKLEILTQTHNFYLVENARVALDKDMNYDIQGFMFYRLQIMGFARKTPFEITLPNWQDHFSAREWFSLVEFFKGLDYLCMALISYGNEQEAMFINALETFSQNDFKVFTQEVIQKNLISYLSAALLYKEAWGSSKATQRHIAQEATKILETYKSHLTSAQYRYYTQGFSSIASHLPKPKNTLDGYRYIPVFTEICLAFICVFMAIATLSTFSMYRHMWRKILHKTPPFTLESQEILYQEDLRISWLKTFYIGACVYFFALGMLWVALMACDSGIMLQRILGYFGVVSSLGFLVSFCAPLHAFNVKTIYLTTSGILIYKRFSPPSFYAYGSFLPAASEHSKKSPLSLITQGGVTPQILPDSALQESLKKHPISDVRITHEDIKGLLCTCYKSFKNDYFKCLANAQEFASICEHYTQKALNDLSAQLTESTESKPNSTTTSPSDTESKKSNAKSSAESKNPSKNLALYQLIWLYESYKKHKATSVEALYQTTKNPCPLTLDFSQCYEAINTAREKKLKPIQSKLQKP